jgi:hypothetical protein
MLSNPVARKVALAVIVKVVIIAAALWYFWPTPKAQPIPKPVGAIPSTLQAAPQAG